MIIRDSSPVISSLATVPTSESVVDIETLWTVEDVAKYFKLNPETIRKMARSGELPATKIRRVWRFRKANIMRLMTHSYLGENLSSNQ